MSLWLLFLLGASCDPAQVASLPEPKREAGCLVAGRAQPAPSVDRAALEEIYAQPKMARARIRSGGNTDALLARLVAWLDRVAGTRGVETYTVVTRWLVMALGAGAALWAIAKLLERRRRPAAAVRAVQHGGLKLEDPALHFSRAQQALQAAPREALREALLGLLSSLERARLARPDRVKTNRELVRELPQRGASAELAQAVGRALDWYDETFYSLRPVEKADAQRFLDDAQALGARAGSAA